jgi:hypothetical protein
MTGSVFSASAPRARRAIRIAVQEYEADAEARRQLESRIAGDRPHELGGHLQQQPAAVTGLAVGGNRTAMGQPVQRADRRLDQPVTRRVIEVGNQSETAGIAFVRLATQSPVGGSRITVMAREARTGLRLFCVLVDHALAHAVPCLAAKTAKPFEYNHLPVRGSALRTARQEGRT